MALVGPQWPVQLLIARLVHLRPRPTPAAGCQAAWKKSRSTALLTSPRKLLGQSVRFPERQGIWATTDLLPHLR